MAKKTDGDDAFIRKGIKIAVRLNELADEALSKCDDDGCLVLCGVMRDCAYRIRRKAEVELDAHRTRKFWKENGSPTKGEAGTARHERGG